MNIIRTSVLIVDDESEICTCLAEYLEDRGFKSFWATEIPAALSIAQAVPLDVILLDNHLSDNCKGIAHIPSFKALQPANGVLYMLTADPKMGVQEQAHQCGADGFIMKPFDFDLFDLFIDKLKRKEK